MDEDLPGYAWDLLPYDKKPLDLYRSPMWHAEYDYKKKTPYAAIQTSLGGTVASGATDVYLAKTISVPADASLVVSDTPIYLREGDILKGGASAVSDLELFITYEVLDDA